MASCQISNWAHIRKLTHKMSKKVKFKKVQTFILNQLFLMWLAQLRPIAAIFDTRLNILWSFLCSYTVPMRFSRFLKNWSPQKRVFSQTVIGTGMWCGFVGSRVDGTYFRPNNGVGKNAPSYRKCGLQLRAFQNWPALRNYNSKYRWVRHSPDP